MQNSVKKHNRWLLPAVLILFILEIFTFPLVIQITYAGRSEAPDRTLTYTPGSLEWDGSAGVDKNGAALLSLFNTRYGETVLSENGDRVAAPGTDGFNIVRLKNSADKTVGYTAVLYEIKDNPEIPVNAELAGNGFSDTADFALPDKVSPSSVIRAVEGEVRRGEIQDFDINWLWEYYSSDEQDAADTLLGNMAARGEKTDVTVGLYIVVSDNNEYITPDTPNTGLAGIGMYLALMLVSAVLLIFLAVSRRREKKCAQ